VDLPVMPPVKPMLARSVPQVPDGPGYLYEPKWDGFRCIVFRDGDEVELGSRKEKPLTRYFPDVVQAVLRQFPQRCVVDGEIVVVGEHGPWTTSRCWTSRSRSAAVGWSRRSGRPLTRST
jgi:ATP-dependent DNA ligase